jgi:superfamily I DNA/RNA helicase/RecB family exonuclease
MVPDPSLDEPLSTLDPAQSEAATTLASPAVLLGPAGSGKTTILVERIARVLNSGISADKVLILAVSRRGADDLSRRLAARFGTAAPTVVTFHAFAFNLVKTHYREAGYRRAPRPFPIHAVWQQLRQALSREDVRHWPRYRDALTSRSLAALLSDLLSGAANNDLAQPQIEQLLTTFGRHDLVELAAFADRYRSHLKRECLLGSEQAVTEALRILEDNMDTLVAIQTRYQYVLADEFEDATYAQARLARLVGGYGLFIAGNPLQATSSYSGGSPAYLTELARSPEARVVHLTTSHRQPPIQEVAQRLFRSPAAGAIDREATTPDTIGLRTFRYQTEESAWIARAIASLLRSGVAPRDVAVLFRTGSDPIARDLAARLHRADIPVQSDLESTSAGADPLVSAAMDIVRYRLAFSTDRPVLFLRLLATPIGGLTRAEMRSLRREARDRHLSVLALAADPAGMSDLPAEVASAATELLSHLASLEAHLSEPADAFLWRLWVTFPAFALDATRQDPAAEVAGSPAAYRVFLDEAARIVADTPSTTLTDLLGLYDAGHFHEIAVGKPHRNGPGITLATIHQSKGNEWAHVFLPNVVEGVYPLRQSHIGNLAPMLLRGGEGEPDSLKERHSAEERRILYVGLTRAVQRLHLSTSGIAFDGTTRLSPSRYVSILGLQPAAGTAGHLVHTADDLAAHYRRQLKMGDPLSQAQALHGLARLTEEFPAQVNPSYWWDILDETAGAQHPYPHGSLRLSASRLSSYRDCPLAFKFGQHLKLEDISNDAMSLGTLLHDVLEAYHVPGANHPRTREALEALVDERYDPAAFSRPPIARQVRRKISELLNLYFPRYGQTNNVVAVETSFRFQLGPHFVAGRIDRIDRRQDGTLELFDYKSGGAITHSEAETDIQLALYVLAFGYVPDLAILGTPGLATYLYIKTIGTRADGKRSYEPTEDSQQNLLTRIDRYSQGILSELFPSRFHILGSWSDLAPEEVARIQRSDPCHNCGFTWLCPEMERGLIDG